MRVGSGHAGNQVASLAGVLRQRQLAALCVGAATHRHRRRPLLAGLRGDGRIRLRRQVGQLAEETRHRPQVGVAQAIFPGRHAAHLDAVAGDPVHLAQLPVARGVDQRTGYRLHALADVGRRHRRRTVAGHAVVAIQARAAPQGLRCGGVKSGGRRHLARVMPHRFMHALFQQGVSPLEVLPGGADMIVAATQHDPSADRRAQRRQRQGGGDGLDNEAGGVGGHGARAWVFC